MALFRQYILVGGLPAAVANWIDEHSPFNLNRIQHELLTTYRDDFAKYKGRLQLERLDDVMQAVPKCIGHKFVFSRINPHANIKAIKQALYLLSKAQLCSPVLSCTANGIPLAAESNEKHFKVIFLDVGLTCAALQLTLTHISSLEELNLINNGSITEQVVGQLLRTIAAPYIEPHLYYWQREEQNSNAEIDYLIQHGNQLIPIEVKAGSTGSLKSLHVFMGVKNLSTAIRINSDLPSKTTVKVKNSLSQLVEYNLLSIPVYLTGQIHRLLETLS
jgi:predicted AAA+ superfamily ATPase